MQPKRLYERSMCRAASRLSLRVVHLSKHAYVLAERGAFLSTDMVLESWSRALKHCIPWCYRIRMTPYCILYY